MDSIRILLADDHTLVRESLRMLISAQADMTVVAEAPDSFETLRQAILTQPDVICLDVSMPGSGIGVTHQIRQQAPRSRILVLTMHEDGSYLRAALASGCAGYVLKSSPPARFLAGIRAVRDGQVFVDEALQEHLYGSSLGHRVMTGKAQSSEVPASKLSERERQVLECLAQGLSYQDISDKLCVSVKTVETYRTRLATKLGFRSRADLVRFAIESGVLTTPGARANDVLPS